MIKLLKLSSVISICLSIIACEKQVNSGEESTTFFITQDTVSGIAFSKLVNSLESLPKEINGCKATHQKPTNQLLLQCSKKGFNYTNKQVRDALSGSSSFSFDEEFGQFNYKWKSNGISCLIAIEEENDIFELWCGKGT